MIERSVARARVRRFAHLVSRFFGSLRARPLDAAAAATVAAVLEPAEWHVWATMPRADQAESVAVLRRLDFELGGGPEAGDARWRAAAILHDAGKQLSGFGTIGRAVVTVITVVLGDRKVRAWVDTGALRARMGRYVAHDDLGAELLRESGARPEVAAWAGAHHRPQRWPTTAIPPAVCEALAAADGETRSNSVRG